MEGNIIWELGSNNQENANNLANIRKWWQEINGKEISWCQRIMTSTNLSEIHWEQQRFDETFKIINPDLRGITFYWQKPNSTQEYNITPQKIELDNQGKYLYIYSQTQKNLIIRVGPGEITYLTVELLDAEIKLENNILILRDNTKLIEVKLTLSPEKFYQLKQEFL